MNTTWVLRDRLGDWYWCDTKRPGEWLGWSKSALDAHEFTTLEEARAKRREWRNGREDVAILKRVWRVERAA